MYREPIKRLVKPPNQLQDLTEEQLKEEVTVVLTTTNPQVPSNTVFYNYKERGYRQHPQTSRHHLVVHFAMDGNTVHKDSNEAMEQEDKLAAEGKIAEDASTRLKDAGGEGPRDAVDVDTGKNQFNYSERAAQTFNNQMKERGVATEPPPTLKYSATVSQWDIYDFYMDNYISAQKYNRAAKTNKNKDDQQAKAAAETSTAKGDVVHSQAMGRSLKILERMVNQNAEDEIFQDFKYWEDASDQFRVRQLFNGAGQGCFQWSLPATSVLYVF